MNDPLNDFTKALIFVGVVSSIVAVLSTFIVAMGAGVSPYALMDVIEETHPEVNRILAAGCGPASFTVRLARRFKDARIYSIDYDPVLLKLAKNNTSIYGSRVKILEYDLKGNAWARSSNKRRVDVSNVSDS